MKKKLLLGFCTSAMMLLLSSTAYAWEAIDTNQDGKIVSEIQAKCIITFLPPKNFSKSRIMQTKAPEENPQKPYVS